MDDQRYKKSLGTVQEFPEAAEHDLENDSEETTSSEWENPDLTDYNNTVAELHQVQSTNKDHRRRRRGHNRDFKGVVITALLHLCRKVDVIQQQLDEITECWSTGRRASASTVPRCPLQSPLTTLTEFDAFEKALAQDSYLHQLIAYLEVLGGDTARNLVKRMMQILFARPLLNQFNMNGRYGRLNFRMTRSYAILEEVFSRWNVGRGSTQLDFEKAVRSFLKVAVTAAGRWRRKGTQFP